VSTFDPLRPYRGTSPKYDQVKSECGFTVFIVGSGGGRVGVVDFYCHKSALVVEVDGDIRDLQQDEDARREKALREMGLRIVRFRNDEVVRNVSAVVGRIKEFILQQSHLPRTASAG